MPNSNFRIDSAQCTIKTNESVIDKLEQELKGVTDIKNELERLLKEDAEETRKTNEVQKKAFFADQAATEELVQEIENLKQTAIENEKEFMSRKINAEREIEMLKTELKVRDNLLVEREEASQRDKENENEVLKEYELENGTYRSTISKLEEQVLELEKEIEADKKNLIERDEVNRLKGELGRLNEVIDERDRISLSDKALIERLQIKVDYLEKEQSHLFPSRIDDLQKALNAKITLNDEISAQLSHLSLTLETERKERDTTVNTLTHQSSQMEESNAILSRQIDSLKSEIQTIHETNKHHNIEIESRCREMSESVKLKDDRCKDLLNSNTLKDERCKELLQALDNEKSNLASQMELAANEIDRLKNDVRERERSLESSDREMESLLEYVEEKGEKKSLILSPYIMHG